MFFERKNKLKDLCKVCLIHSATLICHITVDLLLLDHVGVCVQVFCLIDFFLSVDLMVFREGKGVHLCGISHLITFSLC